MNAKKGKLIVQDVEISLTTVDKEDYICLTDMAKAKNDDARAADIIKNWIRNRATIEFLGVWETIYNPASFLKWSNSTTLKKRPDYLRLQ